MKQFIPLFIFTVFLAIVSVASAKSTQSTDSSSEKPLTMVDYSFENHTCTLLDPDPDLGVPVVPNEDLQLTQNMRSIENVIVEEKDGPFIDIILSTKNGNSIYIVQSQEDFMDNSSVNVESIELQWADGTPNDEARLELTGQEVDGQLIDLTFKATNISNGCIEFLNVFRDMLTEDQLHKMMRAMGISTPDTQPH